MHEKRSIREELVLVGHWISNLKHKICLGNKTIEIAWGINVVNKTPIYTKELNFVVAKSSCYSVSYPPNFGLQF